MKKWKRWELWKKYYKAKYENNNAGAGYQSESPFLGTFYPLQLVNKIVIVVFLMLYNLW